MFCALAVAAIVASTGCTDQKEAERVLKMNGYTDIEYTGYSWFDCSETDFYATGFKAVGPTGVPAKGTVCSGLFIKGTTIRF